MCGFECSDLSVQIIDNPYCIMDLKVCKSGDLHTYFVKSSHSECADRDPRKAISLALLDKNWTKYDIVHNNIHVGDACCVQRDFRRT